MESGARIVHIVDDDSVLSDALCFLFRSRGVDAIPYLSAESFLSLSGQMKPGCILLDVRMSGMSGPELFERLRAQNCQLPVIFLTGHGDVPMAVNALKNGAFDFVEKPFNDNALVDRVLDALNQFERATHERATRERIDARLATLSEREQEIMQALLEGRMNKVIADDLGIAMRTVEVHRARIFEKMGVRSAVELANLIALRRHTA